MWVKKDRRQRGLVTVGGVPSQICDILPMRFLTYVSPSGARVVQKAIDALSPTVLVVFKTELKHLAASPRQEWPKRMKKLKSRGGVFEIRFKAEGKQWRPLGFFGPGPGQFTITELCTHKQNIYDPHEAIERAGKRWSEIEAGQAGTAHLQINGEDIPTV